MAHFRDKLTPESLEAVLYTRDFRASSVLDSINAGELDSFSETPEAISYYQYDDWKVYKITVTIEPVE